MGRECSSCGIKRANSQFSRTQWCKGKGISQCRDCVDGKGFAYICNVCNRQLSSQNTLNIHMQRHRPRNTSCPVCGESRFKSGANAVQHVESGSCQGCPGTKNARNQIYCFAQQQPLQRYMTGTPLMGHSPNLKQHVPDHPYTCRGCKKVFRQMSQLLQHLEQKHQNIGTLFY